MEETLQIISKKRRRSSSSSSSHPLMGIFTRSKSKIYLHCNRSGRARSDSSRINKQNPVGLQSKEKKPRQKDSSDIGEWSCVVIKDLRARRVFSLADNDCRLCDGEEERKESEKRSGEFSSFDSIDKEDTGGKCSDGRKVEENRDIMEPVVEYSSATSCETEGDVRNDVLIDEQCLQATPPDSEMLLHMGTMECVSANLSTENLGKSEALQDQKIANSPAPKSVPNPWSRVRVFKAPGSLSYRKLLPYLMDMIHEYDNSCSPKKGKFPNITSQQEVSVDKQVLADGSGTDSSMLFGSQKDNSKRVDSTTLFNDQCRSKDNANVKIGMRVACKDKDFESSTPECYSVVDSSQVNGYSNNTKPLDYGESKGGVSHLPCIVEDANEESIQMMTPPDADISGKAVVYQNIDDRIKLVSPNADQVLRKPLNASDKRTDSSSKMKWGLNPCSQLKLFKTRSSFNYRRMLPYLMDIAKDNSGDSRNGNCPKLEKSSQENLVPPASVFDHSDSPVEKLHDTSCHMEYDTDPCSLQMSSLPDNNHPSNSNQLNLIPSDDNTDIPESVGLLEKQESQVIVDTSDNKDGHSDSDPGTVNLVNGSSVAMATCSSLVNPPSVSGKFLDSVSQELPAKNDKCRTSVGLFTNAAEPVEGGNFSENSSKLEASDPWRNSANGSAKSILKRHPRGCRGLCTCLDCASFRLHAERAFEFSKNQMQDAEEVALDLIKELSHVRNMLENAASDSNDHLVICNNGVKEACRKLSEAEELAKSRLIQMNYDLNIHCRISVGERPRVRFANNVEKRIFHG
ncbi:conserved hypothetical protein [Ricinus communis]|uniref:Uncharacterized protein n=1 Tax=Ricinus communis TaxID=3988 RepID=B9RY12_RICCO|nr:conserved hypothetical protein [Ricinus communis]|eukprot:XP_002518631.1 uncharacterized protein LOC8280963 [Ricinus communis]